MDRFRRSFLANAAKAGALALAVGTGLLRPLQALADWNKSAFEAKNLADALKNVGVTNPVDSKDILIKIPDVAENGAVVPVEVTSRIPGTESIAILVEKNVNPLATHFNLPPGTEGYISTRIKMAQTSNVRAVVKAGGKFYTAAREVKVTVGGCN